MKALIGKKIGMSSTISDNGVVEPVTLLNVCDNIISQIKTIEIDGYSAIQVATGKAKKTKKPQINHFLKSKTDPKIAKEFRVDPETLSEYKIGDKFTIDTFQVGDLVNVTSTSKGKGFAGTIKRHNFKRGRK